MRPQMFQPVKFPCAIEKNMDDDVTGVHQDPLVEKLPFNMTYDFTGFFKTQADIFSYRSDLPFGQTRTYNKAVDDDSIQVSQIESDDIFGFFLL